MTRKQKFHSVDAQNRRSWNNVNPTVNLQESKEHKMYRGSPQGLGYVHTDSIVFLWEVRERESSEGESVERGEEP